MAHQTHRVAQSAVANELCKRGYEVHNTSLADLMAISPNDKKQFLVDVKGSAKPNQYWLIRKKDLRHNLFYILAVVPKTHQINFIFLRKSELTGLLMTSSSVPGLNRKPAAPTILC